MSCHDVGRALNSVGAVVLGMYDKGRIPLEEARELLVATRLGVHWCDGNEYEAVDELSKNHCGHCLRKLEVGAPLYDVDDVSRDVPDRYRMYDHPELPIASGYLCPECFDRLLALHAGDPGAGPRERTYIEKTRGPQHWHAVADNESHLSVGFGW